MMKSCVGVLAFLILVAAMSSVSAGARPDLIEVVVGDDVYQGQAVANTKSDFWLLQRDGRLRQLPIKTVTRFRSVAPRFRGFRAAEMKAELRKEFGKEFEVVSTTHYVVAGHADRVAKLAEVFENVYRTFVAYFGPRGFQLKKPAFPLVAVVFRDQEQFVQYAQRDGIKNASQILGYYHLGTNRVALFDEPNAELTRTGTGNALSMARARVGGQTTLEETIIHEGTHQVAFNTGVHSRIGHDPRWFVEGLAMVFEAPGIRNRSDGHARSRMNAGRLIDFRKYISAKRKPASLKAFVESDSLFTSNIYAFYGEAWALSFFLLETRSAQYSKYLKSLAERNPLKPYTTQDRLIDFKRAFGNDLDRLERDYLRFVGGL